jgi:D-glycero-alpha-D-manno-heptose 1-phosphate guanylyltransferase
MRDVTAAILVGGLGTRLRPVIADRPKALAPIDGRPFLTHVLDQIEAAGIRRVVLCTGYLADQVPAALGTRYGGLSLEYSPEPIPLGTGGGLRLAAPRLDTERVLVMNGDSYCDVNLTDFARALATAPAAMVLAQVLDTARYGRVRLDHQGHVTAFLEKDGLSRPGRINAGIYLLQRHLLDTIPRVGAVSLEREVFPKWVAAGALRGYRCNGAFLDIGTPESYAAATAFFQGLRAA